MKLTPVSGQTNIYTMERMDQPTELGTPISKATLLKDSTAELYGLGPDATPDDIFQALAAPDYASKLIIHVAAADGGSVGGTRVRIRNEELGVYLVKPLDALGNATFEVLQNHTYYAVLIDYPDQYYGAAALIPATGGQVQRKTITLPTEPDIIGWRIDESTGTVEYTDGAKSWIPASMVGDAFEPGSLGGSWLFKNIRPCLLKNGVVQYYLDQNDYSKKTDGTDADIISGNDGDVMIEFPLVYYKFYSETAADGTTYIGCKFSLSPPDGTYCANAFASESGVIQQTMYMAAYEGVVYNGKLRSLSGAKITSDEVIGSFDTYAAANGNGYQQQEWCKRTLLQAMFVMMFCGLDSQALLGFGSDNKSIATGTMNTKGLCWGDQTRNNGVKFLGIENFWGNKWKWCKGWRTSGNIYYYNTHAPYDRPDESFIGGSDIHTNNPIDRMRVSNAYGMFPRSTVSSNGAFCDLFYISNQNYDTFPATGGYTSDYAGIFAIWFEEKTVHLDIIAAYLSYTPQGG